jgi:FixJ family two-component response regulator
MRGATVYVIDDDPSVQASLRRLFHLRDLKVEAFSRAEDFLALRTRERPACIVSDIRMPGLSGLDLQDACERKGIRIPMIFLTGHGDIPMTVRAIQKGAVDFLAKPFDADALLGVVARALRKDRTGLQEERKLDVARQRWETLSPREREVLAGVIAGRLNKQIAFRLGIMEKTVKYHRGKVMRKMQADSVAHLVRLAELLGVRAARR